MSATAPTLADTERFQATFFEECTELLQDLEERLPSLQAGNIDSEGLNAVFRAVHSIKAGAAAFNFTAACKVRACLRGAAGPAAQRSHSANAHVFSAVVRGADLLAELVDAARSSRAVPSGFGDSVISELHELLGTPETAAGSAPAKAHREERGTHPDLPDRLRAAPRAFPPCKRAAFAHPGAEALGQAAGRMRHIQIARLDPSRCRGRLPVFRLSPHHEGTQIRRGRGLRVRR